MLTGEQSKMNANQNTEWLLEKSFRRNGLLSEGVMSENPLMHLYIISELRINRLELGVAYCNAKWLPKIRMRIGLANIGWVCYRFHHIELLSRRLEGGGESEQT